MGLNLYLGQFVTFFMMAIALGLDAFSLGIGIGMKKLSWLKIGKISTTIGLFHVIMPLIGILAGQYLLRFIGDFATLIGGGLLIILGFDMLWSSITGNEAQILNQTTGIGLLLLATSVSIDSLSVGFTLGLFSKNLWAIVLLFGTVGALMTALGLSLGTKIADSIGVYGEAFGGIILIIFGFKFLV